MKRRVNNSSFLIIILLLINSLFCQIKVYPDHYVESDSAFPSSSLYLTSDIKERQIYKLGYFSTDSNSIKSYKFGYIYNPDNFCHDENDSDAITQGTSIYSTFGIKDQENTRENNFSEELELLKHYCRGKKLIINTPFPILHNTGYSLNYKLSITNDFTANSDFSLDLGLRAIETNGASTDNNICQFNMKGSTPTWMKVTIKSKLSSSNKITMVFLCDGDDNAYNLDVNTDDKLQFILGKDSNTFNIYISFYQVILEDSSSSYFLSYTDNKIVRTFNGMEKCDNNLAEATCLTGYTCDGNECQKCDSTCYECETPGSCKSCNVLTDVDNTNTGTSCELNYIDLSNFDDFEIDVPLYSNEFHERSTMGFWIFISDMTKARTGNSNIYHVVLKDRYVISIIPNDIYVGVYCHAYEDLYRTITTETIFESHYSDRQSEYVLYRNIPTAEQLKYINSNDLSGQWFHVSCGLSFDHKMYHLTTVINGEVDYYEKALRHENLYYDSEKNEYIENDIYYRHIVKDEAKLIVQFKNFGKAGTKVFLKYFLLFQEYIPPSYKFMYYDFFDIADADSNKQIILQIKFNKLEYSAPTYRFYYRDKDSSSKSKEFTNLALKTIDLLPPKNFKLLVLPGVNKAYKNIDCKTGDGYLKTINGDGKINWDENKPLFCPIYLDTRKGKCVSSCTVSNNKYIVYPGISAGQGNCDFLCSGPMVCDYTASSFCKDENKDIYNLFYSCEDKKTKYYLQYSSFYTPGEITIDVNNYDSYIIEIWYYPDFFLTDSNRQGKFYFPDTLKNYVFYSNVAQAYFLHSEYKKLKVEDTGSTYTSSHYHPYEWNKLVFYGKKNTTDHYKYFIINNLVDESIRFKQTSYWNSLSSISFFTSLNGNNWATGYYRDLRIWDGSVATPELTVIYDNYFTSAKGRINSIIGYYPLTNEYISGNIIKERLEIGNTQASPNSANKLRRINFSSKFDFIRTKYPSLGYYLISDATAPKPFKCQDGCLRCWNSGNDCYECNQGYLLTMERSCVKNLGYYFKSPCDVCDSNPDAVLKIDNEVYNTDISPITVTFWIKPLGFVTVANKPIDVIYYSDVDILRYNNNKGLILVSQSQELSTYPDFKQNIGKWIYIALSYYKKQEFQDGTTQKVYYPQMVNFEVNGKAMIFDKLPTELKFDKFRIPQNLYAFLCNVRYYHEYLVGAYGFATNVGNLISPFSIPQPKKTFLIPGDGALNCKDNNDFLLKNGDQFSCAGDHDRLFETFATSFNNYIEIEKGFGQPKECRFKRNDETAFCLNACKGKEDIDCTCMNRNYNSQMLVKDDLRIYCKTFKYINFARAKPIKIKVKTAQETKKFTLQFWMYFYSYTKGTFGGVTFNWEGHTKIYIYKNKNDIYVTNCTIYTMNNKNIMELTTNEAELDVSKWNFFSCSANYEERKFYLNLNNEIGGNNGLDGKRLYTYTINPSEPPDSIVNNEWTYLEITDNTDVNKVKDWGYLFYRQIHLWKYAYFNAEFLSRVNILTPSKFPYLLHSWDTHFKGYKDGEFNNNFIITDISKSAPDFVVTKSESLGFNYISEEEANKIVNLCTEDGEYYDLYDPPNCLPFADLGLLDDFTFTDVPFSYTGTYSMAFWIFFEDASTIGSGIHFKWERHLQITVIKLTQLQGYCLPQGYYSDDISNSQFSEKLGNIPNYIDNTLVTNDQSESGVWIWVICSVSNYAGKYYLKGNGVAIEKNIVTEDLYYSDLTTVGQPVKNAYPYRYFMSEVENGVSQTSKLYIEGLANDKRIYIRDLFLFKDYIPEKYAEAFKNVDLSKISEEWMLQSMVFACNFADFNINKMTLTYYVINQENVSPTSSKFKKTKKTVKLYRSSKISSTKTFELCSNFAFIKITKPYSGDLCKTATDDNKPSTIFFYCNDEKTPIVCREHQYITITSDGETVECKNQCNDKNYMRVPGAPYSSGICSINIPEIAFSSVDKNIGNLEKYAGSNWNCSGQDYQIGYKCYSKDLDEKKSAFFFSRCYNQPNFYGVISNTIKEKLPNGYFYEFWFKLDKVQILQHCATTATQEYILFSTPHSIYLDLSENKYYYKIIDSIYSSTLDGINNYEWNKIVIKTTLGVTLGQNVYVYINFDIDNIKATILNIPSSIKMQLQYISFCSKEANGDCTPAGAADVTWGSAYYRNIRVWELYSSSIYSIQDFNIGIFTDIPLSLKLFYPLKISTMNYNILKQEIDGIDTITVVHEESQNFKSYDAWGFYNYATNFDWGAEAENKDKFISSMNGIYITSQDCGANCERCYTNANTNCYKCKATHVLKGMTCVYSDKTYLKIPNEKKDKIQFEIENIGGKPVKEYPGITITFYMKFEGIIKVEDSTLHNIMELTPKTALAYNSLNSYLELYIEDSSPAFQYTNFYNLIGQWIPYSIAIYRGKDPIPDRYPHMFTFSVNKEDIPFVNGYSLIDTLNGITTLNLGNQVIALFADLRIYNTFIQGSFGQAISANKGDGIILTYSLMGSSATDCLPESQLVEKIEPICVTDYTDYIGKSCGLDTTKYFDLSIPGEQPCASCPDYCKTKCFNPNDNQCTCDLTNGLYWLRRDKTTRQTYCEYLPAIDFSILEDVVMDVPTSQTYESTVEFWIFIYSYNEETSGFKEISIEWNLHNKVRIYNLANTIYADCYAFYDMNDINKYTEKLTLAISGYSWIYIRCGTDYISQTKTYFLNNQESLLVTQNYPDRSNLQTKFKISSVEPNSFGYVFLKEIKLWQQYNFNYINTQYINLLDDVGIYKADNLRSTGIYPGLITFIKGDFNPDDYENVLTKAEYKLENLVGQDIIGYDYPKTYTIKRKSTFLGYNIIDPNNYGYYSELVICGEGYVYNSENNICLEVTVTKCKYPGDISDNCISCPENNLIYPPNGNCVTDCGVRFYPRDDINQCRACHPYCYECFGFAQNNCRSCIDDRYLVEDLHECVTVCQEYGKVASIYQANLCVDFEGYPVIINYNESVPIDINTFDFIVVEILKMNTKPIYQKWSFDPQKTRNANPGLTLNFDESQVPYFPIDDDNLESLNVSLNHSFFELKRNYVFTFEITSYNILNNDIKATRYFDFTLRTNSYPENGTLEIIPETGLHNTTTFLIRCRDWVDDTCEKDDLTYYFYAKEKLSEEIIVLQDWSKNNEITTKFILEKDSLQSNDVTVYCKIRDNYLAENEVEKTIIVSTDLSTGVYNLEDSVEQYYLPDKQLSTDELLHLSEVLRSLGEDLYKVLRPTLYQSIYRPSIDKTLVVETKPECVTFNKECNNRGVCNNLVDEYLVCRCNEGYIGTNCHIDKNGGDKLLQVYKELYSKILSTLQSEISYNEFKAMHNIFNGARYFSEDINIFNNQMKTFLTMAMNVYPKSIDNNTYEYIDLLDFYFSYEYERLNKKRAEKMFNTGLNFRDLPIDKEDEAEFKDAFEYIHNELINLIHYKCNMHINTQIDYVYDSANFYIAVKSVNPTFDEDEFFEERKSNYKSYPKFMTCLNYIENTKLNNPYFQTFMIYIEYYKFPFGYDDQIYQNNTGPLLEIRFLDATTGKNFDLSDCTGANQININTPFTNYRWIDELMEQKSLFDPRNYKSPSDSVFSDPIYINKSGYVSDDTVEERIKKYHRRYNISCRYYDIENLKFVESGVVFTNFTSDTNFIQCNSTHLSRFSTFFVENNATFNIKGRFFYVPRTELLDWKDNYKGNFGFIVFLILIIAYAGLSLVLGCYDNIFFVKETLLESLKIEIIKSFMPYKSRKEREQDAIKLIPISLDPGLIDERKFGDKTKENKRYDNDETKNDNDILSSTKPKERDMFGSDIKGIINSGDRLIKIKNNKSNEYFNQKNNKQENIMASGNKRDLKLDMETKDFYGVTTAKNEFIVNNINRLEENFEDPNEEYNRALYSYANLSLTFCEFFIKNILLRTIIINPFINISMFCPRWKKLILFTTNVLCELLLLSVFLTNDENALDTNLPSLIKYSFYTVLITDTFMHFMALFFQFSGRQKRRLLKLVRFKGQLIVMKEYEDMQLANNILTVVGALICYGIWIFTFYMSFAFYSVWKVQNKAYVYSFFITVGLDFVGLELLYELFLAIIYMQRKSSKCLRVIGEFLNRLRNHRCLN